MSENQRPGVSRRGFLKALGLVSAGVMANPGSVAGTPRGSIRAGVLVPSSRLAPSLADNFTAGLRAGLASVASNVELIVEDTGTSPSQALGKCRRLVEEIKADIVVAMANEPAADELAAIAKKRDAPLVLATAGTVLRAPARNTDVLVHSLKAWQSNWALGAWAARNLGPKAMSAASMFESGYDSLYAFELGFEAAGGKILSTRVTDAPYNPGGIYAFLTEAERERPDVVFASYSGYDAIPFVRAWAGSELAGTVPLVASPFLVDEDILPSLGSAAIGMRSVSPCAPLPDRTTNLFSMLGFECGRTVGDWAATGRLAAGAERPLFLREVRGTARGLANEIVTELDGVDESDERLVAFRSGVRSGWVNTYLSV